jgi:hypothetical protein
MVAKLFKINLFSRIPNRNSFISVEIFLSFSCLFFVTVDQNSEFKKILRIMIL